MSSSAQKRRRSMESEPATRRSARIQALSLARSESIQAGDSALPALRTREGKSRKKFVPPSHEDKFLKLRESLLPGISNDVALAKISTLLPDGTLQILSSSSSTAGPAWRQSMEDRLVYDARVLANSGDSCVIISDTKSSGCRDEDITTAIFLYSLRDFSCYQLPPIAHFENGFPYDCECIALDGRVYVLGGTKKSSQKSPQLSSKDVYVLDLAAPRAAQGQWKLCARMQAARANFRCGVKNGKIYAFGGTCGKRWVGGSEVYDPSVNSWSAITPITSLPSANERNVDRRAVIRLRVCSLHNAVATGGEELVVLREEPGGGQNHLMALQYHLMGYYPVTDTWRTLSDDFPIFFNGPSAVEFMAEGKLHAMRLDSIRVYDIEENRWTERYSCSFRSTPLQLLWPISALAVDNEIVAIIERNDGLDNCIVRSIGFGSDVNQIVWEELPCSFPVGIEIPSMCFLKL